MVRDILIGLAVVWTIVTIGVITGGYLRSRNLDYDDRDDC